MPRAEQVISHAYRLEAPIGEGGMGTIWRARHEVLGRLCAVKFLRPTEGPDPTARTERFLREAKVVASIQSRFVVSLFDFGTTDDGELFMVMELLQGRTFAARLAARPAPLLREVVRLVDLTLAGLQAVHGAGIVHRDLKPDNVFLVEDADGSFPKLLDFGISRPMGEAGARSAGRMRKLTQAGMTMGTPHYMAPEQIRGDAGLDGRADLYTLGVLLFKAATGRFPIEADNVLELMVKVVSEPTPDAATLRREIPSALAQVIARALERDPRARFASAPEMRQALRAAAATLPPRLPALWDEGFSAVPAPGTFGSGEAPAPAILGTAELAQTPPEAFAGTLVMGSGALRH
jgi:serine/threonine-protein kinase